MKNKRNLNSLVRRALLLQLLVGSVCIAGDGQSQSEDQTTDQMSPVSPVPMENQARDILSRRVPDINLVDPLANDFSQQIVFLEFGGAERVDFRGPIEIEDIEVPAFTVDECVLEGSEYEIIEEVLTHLNTLFDGTGVSFTVAEPPLDADHSTIFIGGDGTAFSEYGEFVAIAEQIDVGNSDPNDEAFVFSGLIVPSYETQESLAEELSHTIAYMTAHLLGYAKQQTALQGDRRGEPTEEILEARLESISLRGGCLHIQQVESSCLTVYAMIDPGTCCFRVNGVFSNTWTEWYINGGGPVETDHSKAWNGYWDPEWCGHVDYGDEVRAEMYDGDWVWEECHVWRVAECTNASDCPTCSGDCKERICNYDFTCGCANSSSGTSCNTNGSGGSCDAQDTCNGSGTCVERYKSSGTSCPDDGQECTKDQCNGSSRDCQHPPESSTTTCETGGSGGSCDAQDKCNGSGQCQEKYKSPGSSCPDDGETCTKDECNGNSRDCQHPPEPSTKSCETGQSGGACDAQDKCNGSGSCDEKYKSSGTSCPDDGQECTNDQCNGSSRDCQHPPKPSGTNCETGQGGGDCDDQDKCNGSGSCTEIVNVVGTVCPDDGNNCTNDECNGTSRECQHPPKPSGTNCETGQSGDDCDAQDECDESGACIEEYAPSSQVCRQAIDDCDIAENCTGNRADCPVDGFTPDGTPCTDDGLFCNGDEECESGTCVLGRGDDPCELKCCDEITDFCKEDTVADPCCCENDDTQCDDGLFCNGEETCDVCDCVSGTPPSCSGDECCEDTDACAECCNDDDCSAGEVCVTGECTVEGCDPPCDQCDEECDDNETCQSVDHCGDGACVAGCGETAATCCEDCGCPDGQECVSGACIVPPTCDPPCDPCDEECVSGTCQPTDHCGNGPCEPFCDENAANCCEDCGECCDHSGCGPCEECQNGSCQSECDDDECCEGDQCEACEWDLLLGIDHVNEATRFFAVSYPDDALASVPVPGPNESEVFFRWVGADVPLAQERSNPLYLLMDSDKTVTAQFQLAEDDDDRDGVANGNDNCPTTSNPGQDDDDIDGVGDACDNCPSDFNPFQTDCDGDREGDACDANSDCDGDDIPDDDDNCQGVHNEDQADGDDDGVGDACDNCPDDPNPYQADCDDDLTGNVCDEDFDDCQQNLVVEGPGRLPPGWVGCYYLTLDGDPVAFDPRTNCEDVDTLLLPVLPVVDDDPLHVCYRGPDVNLETCTLEAEHRATGEFVPKPIEVGCVPLPGPRVCGCGAGSGVCAILIVLGLFMMRFLGPRRRNRATM